MGRAMTTPNLSISIPAPKPKNTMKDGDMVPEEDEDSEAELTAASSICQSPGWDDATTKKQKKEKEEARKRKKKEMEKAAAKALAKAKAEAKQAEKEKRNRLSKVNPANGRLSRMGFMMNRSSSMPAVAPASQHTKSISQDIASTLQNARQGAPQEVGVHQAWETVHKIPEQNVLKASAPQQHPMHSRASSQNSDSFSGGLKPQLATEAVKQNQEENQQHPQNLTQNLTQSRQNEQGTHDSAVPDIIKNCPSQLLSDAPASDTARTPEQWESIYERAANLMRAGGQKSRSQSRDAPLTGMHGENTRKKSNRPASYFPEYLEYGSTARNPPTVGQSRTASQSRTSDEQNSQHRPSSSYSSNPPSITTGDTSIERGTSPERGRPRPQKYSHSRRQQSEEQAFHDTTSEEQSKTGWESTAVKREASVFKQCQEFYS